MTIFDILGRKVMFTNLPRADASQERIVSIESLHNGNYFCQVIGNNYQAVTPLSIVR